MKSIAIIGAGGAIAAPVVAALYQAIQAGEALELNVVTSHGGASTHALEKDGIAVHYPTRAGGTTITVPSAAYKTGNNVTGPVDYVFIGTKGHDVASTLADNAFLIGPQTRVVTVQNGIPFWLPRLPEAAAHHISHISAVDEGGHANRRFGKNVLGGLTTAVAVPLRDAQGKARPATSMVVADLPYAFGNPAGAPTPELQEFVRLLKKGGLNVHDPLDSRALGFAIFHKLMGNMFNFPAAQLDQTVAALAANPDRANFIRNAMSEIKEIALALGIEGAATLDPEERMALAPKINSKTSTAADVAQGKLPEIDPLLRAVIDLGDRLGVPTPHLHAMYKGFTGFLQDKKIPYAPAPLRQGGPTPGASVYDAAQLMPKP